MVAMAVVATSSGAPFSVPQPPSLPWASMSQAMGRFMSIAFGGAAGGGGGAPARAADAVSSRTAEAMRRRGDMETPGWGCDRSQRNGRARRSGGNFAAVGAFRALQRGLNRWISLAREEPPGAAF